MGCGSRKALRGTKLAEVEGLVRLESGAGEVAVPTWARNLTSISGSFSRAGSPASRLLLWGLPNCPAASGEEGRWVDQGGGGGSRRTAFVILTCETSGLRPKRLRVEHLCIAGSGSQGFAGSSL